MRSNRTGRQAQITCQVCGRKASPPEGTLGIELCQPCYDYAGWENTHSDYSHESKTAKAEYGKEYGHQDNCPVCQGISAEQYADLYYSTKKAITPAKATQEHNLPEDYYFCTKCNRVHGTIYRNYEDHKKKYFKKAVNDKGLTK
jgi:hypothetical protein